MREFHKAYVMKGCVLTRCVDRVSLLPVWASCWFILCSNLSITLRATFSLSGPAAWWWSCFTTIRLLRGVICGVWPWELCAEWAADAVVGWWLLSLSFLLWLRLGLVLWSRLLCALPGLEPVPAPPAATTECFLSMLFVRERAQGGVNGNRNYMQVEADLEIICVVGRGGRKSDSRWAY